MLVDKPVLCPVLIGRENDLKVLDRLMKQSLDKNGRIALITGEAGVGKSRFVREVKVQAPQGALILEGACFQTDSALPYSPILELFRNFLVTHTGAEIASRLASSASQLIKLLPELALYLPQVTPAPEPDPQQEKRHIFQALAQTVTELAQLQPLLLILEDLHWCDSTSLEFLLLLARRIPSQPIFLLLTYRAEETTPELTHFLAELGRERLSSEITLKRLSPLEVEAMLRTILNLKSPAGREFLDIIFPLTDGNPFFVEEVLKALVTGGDIFYINGTWGWKETGQLQIPHTIQDAVQRRTRQLDEETLQALRLASVMGRRFDFRLLQHLLEVEEADLMAMLKELIAAQLVVEETADRFAFRHALTREAIYITLLLRERQALHRQVGDAIEQLYAASIRAQLADLSYHYYTAGEWQKTLEYSQRAGDQARRLYSQRESIIYYSRALVAARQLNSGVEMELLSARGHAYEILGDARSALEDFEYAQKVAQEQQDGMAEWRSLIDLGIFWEGRRYQRTGEYFRQAEDLARKLQEPRLIAHSLNKVGNWFFITGQTTQALKCHRQALEFFEGEQDEPGMAETLDLLGMASLHHGDQIGSYAEYGQAIQLFRKLDDKQGLVSALVGAGHSLYDETDFIPSQSRETNQQMAMEAIALADQIGWAEGKAFAEWGMAIGLAQWGRFREALANAQGSLQIASELQHPQRLSSAYYALGYIYLLMLQADLAIQNLEAGLTLAMEFGSAWMIGNSTAELASACLLNGDNARAHSLLDPVIRNEAGHYTRAERRMLQARGNLYLAEGRPAEALQIAEHLLASKHSAGEAQPIPALLQLQGEALFALQQFAKAESSLKRARQGAEDRQAIPLLWQIQARLGWLYKRQRKFEKSQAEFAGARRLLHELEANIPEEAARRDFMQAALRSLPEEKTSLNRRQEAKKYGGLTPREREVAQLVSQGKSNREIAEALVLSERTVENHVGNILKKLGFESRAQIAVWAASKGLRPQ